MTITQPESQYSITEQKQLQTYSDEELKESALKYFNNDDLAAKVWMNKYALKINGQYVELSPDDTLKRIASEIKRAEDKHANPLTYDEIYDNLKGFKNFIFAGSILFGAGNPNAVSLGNCFFVNNNADSYGGIFNLDESIAQLMKRRGGVGVTLEHLRPKFATVNNSAQSSTGAVSFMNRYSNTTREVAQDGRRGALMISLHVQHPDIVDFINAKDDLTQVTGANVSVKMTDEFMEAAKNDQDFYLAWPIQKGQPIVEEKIPYNKTRILDNGTYVKRVKAREVWESIIKMAHKNAEPGVLFWDNIINESPADMYAEDGFRTQGTNPCIVGESLVSVADGRGEVRIDQLAKEGKDVPVYCIDDNNKVAIRWMRNPRITGYNQPIYEIKLDSGDSIKVTGNHKIRLKDGKYKEAKDLAYGESVHVMSKTTLSWNNFFKDSNSKSSDYLWVKSDTYGTKFSEHRMIYEFYHNIKIPKGYVIHHKDYNSLNNSIENLEMMSKEAHDELHTKDMIGELNPYHKMSDEWKTNFASHPGLSNGNYSGITNYKLYKEIINVTKKEGRRLSRKEWSNYAKINSLPEILHSKFRGGSDTFLLKRAANYLGFEYSDKDPRTLRTLQKALANGYDPKIIGNRIIVEKQCEECGKELKVPYDRREYSFCNNGCSNKYSNRNKGGNAKRTESLRRMHQEKAKVNMNNQLRLYSQLKFDLKREPNFKEWDNKCKEEGIVRRLGTKYGFNNFDNIKEYADEYNHKVVKVEMIGTNTVYNGTVDEYHNFYSGMFKSINEFGKAKWLSINQLQCGEVPLSSHDSCRLGSINVAAFIDKPYTDKARVKWSELGRMSRLGQRFMDDIITLEEEKINHIIDKIKNDPEKENIKRTELELWEEVLRVLQNGRRTGLGMLGLGDALASLGITYGSKKATEVAEEIAKVMAINSYKESVSLAKDRGAFLLWDADKEAGNPFLVRVISNNFSNAEYAEYLKYGRRNIANISIAPTGSLAIEAQTTSSMEPVFKCFFYRVRKVNANEEGVKIDFVDDNGDSWEEYYVLHTPFEKWCKEVKDVDPQTLTAEELEELVAVSPWAGSESHNIDYVEKVNMQGAIQKWVDHAISVTHNLPENISVEAVNDIYFQAWTAGCKGCTIYREGSRSGVLSTTKKGDKGDEFVQTDAPKRPKELDADYYSASAKGKKFAVIVGLYKGKPYEMFAFENPPSDKNTRGKVIKIRKGHYKFVNGSFEIDNLELAADRIEERSLTLTVSAMLRHGVKIDYINKIIQKVDENISSFASVVRRYLSRYADAHEINGEACPECGDKLITESGCVQCISCGYSRC